MSENNSTELLREPATDEKLQRIEQTMNEVLAMQKQLLSEVSALRVEVNQRYVDLRGRIELNNDKLDVVQRELRQFIKDTRSPAFASAELR